MKYRLITGPTLGLALNALVLAAGSGTTGMGEAPLIAPSGSGNTQQTGGTARPAPGSRMSGTVESINTGDNRVRIRDGSGIITEYQINEGTRFNSDGRKRRFSDMKTGDSVNFETNPDNGIIHLDFGSTPRKTR